MNDLVENAEWRGKFFAGDVASRSEFDVLTKLVAEADTRSEKVINGTAAPQIFELTTRDQPLSTRDLMTAASGLEEVGITREIHRYSVGDRRRRRFRKRIQVDADCSRSTHFQRWMEQGVTCGQQIGSSRPGDSQHKTAYETEKSKEATK